MKIFTILFNSKENTFKYMYTTQRLKSDLKFNYISFLKFSILIFRKYIHLQIYRGQVKQD